MSAILYKCTEYDKNISKRKKTKFYELWLVTSGVWDCNYKTENIRCRVGKLFLFHPGDAPNFIACSENSRCSCVQLEKNFFESYCKRYDDTQRKLLSAPYLSSSLTNSQLGYLSYLLNHLNTPEYSESLPAIKHFLSNALFAFLAEGWDSFGDTYMVYSLDLIRRMDLFLDLSIDVSEIYAHYPVSPTSLIKEFKQTSGGYTIVQYRHIKRMEYAAQLLTKNNLSVTATADVLNISNPSYFSEQFRKFHGMTPRQYQTEYRKRQLDKGTDE